MNPGPSWGYGLQPLKKITDGHLQGLPEQMELPEEIEFNAVVEANALTCSGCEIKSKIKK